MPCYCPEPSNNEVEAQNICKHLVYVLPMLGREVSEEVQNGAESSFCHLDTCRLTELLCDVCDNLTKKQEDIIIYNSRKKSSRDLANWWEEHQKWDTERKEQEKKEKNKVKVARRALSKLSKTEREALGF